MHRASLRVLAPALTLASLATACGGSGQSIAPAPAAPHFAAASTSVCVHPNTSVQTVSIPSTAGVTATLQFGAFSATTSDCVEVTLATGDAVQSASVFRRNATAVTTSSRPIFTLSVNDAFPGASSFNPLVVEGATLNAPSLAVYPDGIYYAQVTYGPGSVQTVQFKASAGVLTLVNTGTPTAPTVITVVPGSTAVIAVFGPGITPVGPTPSPTPPVTPTPLPLPTGTPLPTATPTSAPTPTSTPANATPTPAQSATPGPTASPASGTFNLHEGPFTSDCNCRFYGKMITSVDVVGAAGGNFTIDDEFADGTSIKAVYFGSNLRASAMAGFPLQIMTSNNYDNFFSSASDVDGSTCGNQASTCSVPVLYSVSSVQSAFEVQFSAYRQTWGF